MISRTDIKKLAPLRRGPSIIVTYEDVAKPLYQHLARQCLSRFSKSTGKRNIDLEKAMLSEDSPMLVLDPYRNCLDDDLRPFERLIGTGLDALNRPIAPSALKRNVAIAFETAIATLLHEKRRTDLDGQFFRNRRLFVPKSLGASSPTGNQCFIGVAPRLLLADRLSRLGIVVPVVISDLFSDLDQDWNWAMWRLLQAIQVPTVVVGVSLSFSGNFERLVMTDWHFKEIPVSAYAPQNAPGARLVTKPLCDFHDGSACISPP